MIIDTRKDRRSPMASSLAVKKSMQGNKGKNTNPEIELRKRLFAYGLRGYRLHWNLPGKPDIAFVGKKVCIFLHGCFWHRCPYCKLSMPKTNIEYWQKKFKKNQIRDLRNIEDLKNDGWKIYVIWECQLNAKSKSALDEIIKSILIDIRNYHKISAG